jgi:ribosomal 50S subunit-associated protein YjgA (DUF615 family)
MLKFYLKEVEKSNNVSEYFLTKERFEKIKKEFEKKDSPTKADTDGYNKGVNEINNATNAYNSNNQQMNQWRKESLDDWNKTVDQFMDSHTPHYN